MGPGAGSIFALERELETDKSVTNAVLPFSTRGSRPVRADDLLSIHAMNDFFETSRRALLGASRAASLRMAWVSASLLTAMLVTGCGAKSALRVPERDGGPIDMLVDLPPDMAPMPDLCIELPPGEPPEFIDVNFVARIATADVLFLVDTTGSMSDEIDQVRARLRDTIVPALVEAIPDVQLGVAEFADYPVAPYGDVGQDLPFRLVLASSGDIDRAQRAVDSLGTRSGSDIPESHVEALFQTATGAGAGRYVPPASCPEGTVGYPCFRANGSRIVLLFTDAEFHNGPGGNEPYSSFSIAPRPAGYDMAVGALRGIGAKVLGLYSGGAPLERAMSDLRAVARDTGAVTADGSPIVLDIGRRGERLDTGVIDAIRTLVEEVPIDIDALAEDSPFDAFDALRFVREIETLGAIPASGAIDLGDRYQAVTPGTRVRFRVNLANASIERLPEVQRYYVNIVLRGDGVTRLQETLVEVVIPSLAGEGCSNRTR